jgi:hypothetical protein
MAFTHVVTFKWSDENFDADHIAQALRDLTSGLDGVQSYTCGADIGRTPASFDFVIIAVFETRGHFTAYRDHPEHQRIVTELVAPNVGTRTVVQLED